jgi:tyrosine-protein kinase Etk/Wzc
MLNSKESFNRQFQEYLRVAYEGRKYIIAIFVIVVIGTWLFTYLQEDVYESRATIRIKKAADILSNQSFKGLVDQDLGFGAERLVANEIRIITSEQVAQSVAEKLLAMQRLSPRLIDSLPVIKVNNRQSTLNKLAKSLHLQNQFVSLGFIRLDTSSALARPEVIAQRIRQQIVVEPVRNVDFISIAANSVSAREAMLIANLVMESYQDRNLEAVRQNITKAKSYLEDQLVSKKDSLAHAEAELRTFQQSSGVVSLDEESKNLINMLTNFEADREKTRIELETNRRVLTEYKDQLSKLEPQLASKLTTISDPYLKQLLEDKAALENNISLTKFNKEKTLSNRPDMVQYVDRQIRDLEQRLAEVNRKIEELSIGLQKSDNLTDKPVDLARDLRQKIITQEITIQSLQAKLNGLDKTIAQYNRKFENIPAQSMEYARLERQRMSREKVFGLLDTRYQEATINEQTTMGTVEVIDRATVPVKPVRPNRPLNMTVGVLLALALGFGLAILLRYLDNTIRSPEDVERLGLPVLTFVPNFGSEGVKRSQSLVTLSAPQSPASEAYRTMRAAIENSVSNNGNSIVLCVTSPAPKEGKSTAIANLAVSAAGAERRVLLIDADLRRPVVHSIFDIDREPGLSDCLTGAIPVNKAIKKTNVPRLHVVPCGHIPSHPAELLGSRLMEKFIALMRQYYDLILIDVPPVIAMADTLMLARLVDGVTLIVSADQTKLPGLQKAKEAIEANNGKVLGVVVNRFNANRIYYSYYRYYYQNYYYYSDDGSKMHRSKSDEKKVEDKKPTA